MSTALLQLPRHCVRYPGDLFARALDYGVADRNPASRHRSAGIREDRLKRTVHWRKPHRVNGLSRWLVKNKPKGKTAPGLSSTISVLRQIHKSDQNIGHHPFLQPFVCPDPLAISLPAHSEELRYSQAVETQCPAHGVHLLDALRSTNPRPKLFSCRQVPIGRLEVGIARVRGRGKRAVCSIGVIEARHHICRADAIRMEIAAANNATRIDTPVLVLRPLTPDEFLRRHYIARAAMDCFSRHWRVSPCSYRYDKFPTAVSIEQ